MARIKFEGKVKEKEKNTKNNKKTKKDEKSKKEKKSFKKVSDKKIVKKTEKTPKKEAFSADNFIMLLSPAEKGKEHPTKTIDENLNLKEGYQAGSFFYYNKFVYSNFHDAMKTVLDADDCFMVLGELNKIGEQYLEEGEAGIRAIKQSKTGKEPTFKKDRKSDQIVLDMDDTLIPSFNPLKPEAGIQKLLKQMEIDCDVTWQITSSQKLGEEKELARLRFYFTATKEHSLKERKAFSQSSKINADGCVYTATQPIYTAPPFIENDGVDPIEKRFGFIKGKKRRFVLPEFSKEEIEINTKDFNASNFDFDFEDFDIDNIELPQEVLSGAVHRRFFMALAFSLANRIPSKIAVFTIIENLSSKCPPERIFNPENVKQYIEDAFLIIKSEEIDEEIIKPSEEKISAKSIKERSREEIPVFPEEAIYKFPHPIPMLWDNFKKASINPKPELLFPTFLTANAYLLKGNYRTIQNRSPNLLCLSLAETGIGKDLNSTEVINNLNDGFKKLFKGSLSTPFSLLTGTGASISSDTAFMEKISENGGELYWTHTEASKNYQQINNASNESVSAIGDKKIFCYDGKGLQGKSKSGKKAESFDVVNVQFNWMTQPERFRNSITLDNLDSGLLGRESVFIYDSSKDRLENDEGLVLLSLSPEEEDNKDFLKFDEEFLEFYRSQYLSRLSLNVNEFETIAFDSKALKEKGAITKSVMEVANDLLEKEDILSLRSVLGRVGLVMEYWNCVFSGLIDIDSNIKEGKPKKIKAELFAPFAEYLTKTKIYLYNNLLSDDLDPLAERIMIVANSFFTLKIKARSLSDQKLILKGFLPRSELRRAVMGNKKLKRLLEQKNDNRNISERFDRIVRSLVENGLFVESEKMFDGRYNKNCLSILKDEKY
jgi:hypothetical protein